MQHASDPEAEAVAARRLAALDPSGAEIQQRLGMALAARIGFDAAVGALRRAVWLAPQSLVALINLGVVLVELRRFREAGTPFRRALGLHPDDPDAQHGIGVVEGETAQLGVAERHLRRALSIRPLHVETMIKHASALVRLRRVDDAASVERKALALAPGLAPAHIDLAVVLMGQETHAAALTCCLRASAVDPNSVQARINAAGALAVLGRTQDAVAMLKRGADIGGVDSGAFRNLLAVMSYMPIDQAARWEAAREFSRRYAARREVPAFANLRDADRRITVGYLSSDLYDHPVARNLLPILEAHDRRRLRIVCYSDADQTDGTTRRARAVADGWRRTGGLADAEVARRIREDAVDVLVIVGGRFDKNRPLVASHRAAPVQMSLFDGGTSGLDDMDYLIADRTLVSPRSSGRERFVERVIRLPSLYVHAPIREAALVSAPPCLSARHVTFGCFNSPMKLSDETLGLWASLLREVGGSRLRLKYLGRYRDRDLQHRVLRRLGVDPGRVDFLWGDDSIVAHLGNYGAVDIALDTFPFTGSTTTWEALWMGVPVVTLCGDSLASRLSASFLRPAKLDELIAATPEDYGRIARELAGDPGRLSILRASLRDRIARSPLCDGGARARQFERIYRAVWRRWCALDERRRVG